MIIKCKMCGGDIVFEMPRDKGCPLNCIQPSKPADRLHKSQAADGLAFLLYTISGFNCAICLRLFIRK